MVDYHRFAEIVLMAPSKLKEEVDNGGLRSGRGRGRCVGRTSTGWNDNAGIAAASISWKQRFEQSKDRKRLVNGTQNGSQVIR